MWEGLEGLGRHKVYFSFMEINASIGVNDNSKNNHQFSDYTVFCDWKNGHQGPPVSLWKRLFSPGVATQRWAPET